jgi:hypothetical protein
MWSGRVGFAEKVHRPFCRPQHGGKTLCFSAHLPLHSRKASILSAFFTCEANSPFSSWFIRASLLMKGEWKEFPPIQGEAKSLQDFFEQALTTHR